MQHLGKYVTGIQGNVQWQKRTISPKGQKGPKVIWPSMPGCGKSLCLSFFATFRDGYKKFQQPHSSPFVLAKNNIYASFNPNLACILHPGALVQVLALGIYLLILLQDNPAGSLFPGDFSISAIPAQTKRLRFLPVNEVQFFVSFLSSPKTEQNST